MKKLLRLFILHSAFFILHSSLAQTTVVFTNALMTGTTNDTSINIKADNNPNAWNGTFYYLYWTGTNITTTNGVGAVRLTPGSYTCAYFGIPRSFKIYVTNSASPLNAAALTTNVVNYSGLQSVTGAGTITVFPPTGSGGNVTVSNGAVTRLTNAVIIAGGGTNNNFTNAFFTGDTIFPNGTALNHDGSMDFNNGAVNIDDEGGVHANSFTGDGSSLTGLTAAQVGADAIGVATNFGMVVSNTAQARLSATNVALLADIGIVGANDTNLTRAIGLASTNFTMTTSNNLKYPVALIVEGDSLSASLAGCNLVNQAWPYQLMTNTILRPIAQMTNLALAGDFATNMVNTYTNQVRTNIQNAISIGQTAYWIIYAGINDINSSFGSNITFTALSNLWRQGRSDGAKVVAFTLPVTSSTGGVLTDVTNLNTMIRAATNQWDYLVEPSHVLSTADSCDGIHYTIGGNQKLAQEVFVAVFGCGASNRFFPNLFTTTLHASEGFPWSSSIDLEAATKFNVTNLGAFGSSPTFAFQNSIYFTTNGNFQYMLIPVPFGLGWSNLEITSIWEGEIGATTSTITQTVQAFRFLDSGRVTDLNNSPTFSISAASLTHVTNTVSFADDVSPREISFIINGGIPLTYGKQKLYLDALKLKSK